MGMKFNSAKWLSWGFLRGVHSCGGYWGVVGGVECLNCRNFQLCVEHLKRKKLEKVVKVDICYAG